MTQAMRIPRIDADTRKAIVLALMRYLREHPYASDTPEAIARWWLRGSPAIGEVEVLHALEWMERYRFVERIAAPDGRIRFRRVATAPWFPRR